MVVGSMVWGVCNCFNILLPFNALPPHTHTPSIRSAHLYEGNEVNKPTIHLFQFNAKTFLIQHFQHVRCAMRNVCHWHLAVDKFENCFLCMCLIVSSISYYVDRDDCIASCACCLRFWARPTTALRLIH